MYVIIRRITVQPGMVEEALRRIEHGLMPLLSHEPGFVAFYLAQVGDQEGVSITLFETKAQAEEGNRKSLEWAKEQIFPLAQGPAAMVGVGEVRLHQGKVG